MSLSTVVIATLVLGQAGSARHAISVGPAIPSCVQAGQRPQTDEEKERARVRIGITLEQQEKIEALYAETSALRKDAFGKLRETFKQLYTLQDTYEFDRMQSKVLSREIMGIHRKLLGIQLDNEEKLRKILNKEQFEKLRAMMKEEREKRERERRPRPPGPPPT